jgi:hypothetical protein
MKVSNKNLLLGMAGAVIIVSSSAMLFSEPDDEYKVAPKGYDYSNSDKLMPLLNAKSFSKSNSNLLFEMREDRSGKLIQASDGYKFVLDTLTVNRSILTSKPVIQYVEDGGTIPVKVQPKNLMTGISYEKSRNGSNFERVVLDEVAFTVLKDWIGSNDPKTIGSRFFGEGVMHDDLSFSFALLSTQRQIMESYILKDIIAGSGYSPLLMKFNQLYVNFIVKSEELSEDIVNKFKHDVYKNITAIANSLAKKKRANTGKLNQKSVLALHYYIHEDLKLLSLVKDAYKDNIPLDDDSKLLLRKKRIDAENRAKQAELERSRRTRAPSRESGNIKQAIRKY